MSFRKKNGLPVNLLRISVGVENINEIIKEFEKNMKEFDFFKN